MADPTCDLSTAIDGVHHVATASGSTYVIDLDHATLVRLTGTSPADWDSSAPMRRDADTVDLIFVMKCRIGEPAVLLVDLRLQRDGVALTTRTTTPVTSITRLSPGGTS